MSADLAAILKLEVPVIVQICRHRMRVSEVLGLVPGAIIELPKQADEPLEVLVANQQIGVGRAVKVGENFGIRISDVGNVRARIDALGTGRYAASTDAHTVEPEPVEAG